MVYSQRPTADGYPATSKGDPRCDSKVGAHSPDSSVKNYVFQFVSYSLSVETRTLCNWYADICRLSENLPSLKAGGTGLELHYYQVVWQMG